MVKVEKYNLKLCAKKIENIENIFELTMYVLIVTYIQFVYENLSFDS